MSLEGGVISSDGKEEPFRATGNIQILYSAIPLILEGVLRHTS